MCREKVILSVFVSYLSVKYIQFSCFDSDNLMVVVGRQDGSLDCKIVL